ncbi:hypothetical protein GN956_G25023 [Arapaima gigas]
MLVRRHFSSCYTSRSPRSPRADWQRIVNHNLVHQIHSNLNSSNRLKNLHPQKTAQVQHFYFSSHNHSDLNNNDQLKDVNLHRDPFKNLALHSPSNLNNSK